MARKKKSRGPLRKLWGLSKLLLLLLVLAAVGLGIWYSQQSETTQREAQERTIHALDWLVEQDETNRQTDEFLTWLIERIPSSSGTVIEVASLPGADRYTFAGIPLSGIH